MRFFSIHKRSIWCGVAAFAEPSATLHRAAIPQKCTGEMAVKSPVCHPNAIGVVERHAVVFVPAYALSGDRVPFVMGVRGCIEDIT